MHCGAACPPAKLACLVELLRPEGGLIVTPVEPSDLRVLVKAPDGSVRQRIISQVRYSTLEARLSCFYLIPAAPERRCLFWNPLISCLSAGDLRDVQEHICSEEKAAGIAHNFSQSTSVLRQIFLIVEAAVQVPSDAEMLLSRIKMERRSQLAIPPLPSTFAADVAAITGAAPNVSTMSKKCFCHCLSKLLSSHTNAVVLACWSG